MITLIELPLVLPPAVAGIALLAAIGPSGILGGALEDAGIQLTFETAGVIVALTFVASPYLPAAGAGLVRRARPQLARGVAHARRLEARTFARVAIPTAVPGLVAGGALAFGRALGEFGATLMFAGSLAGITQTAPLAIYERFATDFEGALALSAVLVAVSAAILLSVKLVEGSWRCCASRLTRSSASSRSTSRSRSRRASASRWPGRRAPARAASCAIAAGLSAPAGRAAWRAASACGSTARGASTCRLRQRRCGYVFQDYALFPHLNAWQNVGYGLPRRGRRERALELLERFGLADRAEARPRTLSGGERQRVALARALAPGPDVLLLDEPLSALDARTRAAAGRELAAVLHAAGVPALLVTHDFQEAALLGDRVGVIDGGRIVQIGSASELAAEPASPFVADFTGAVVLTGTASPRRRRAHARRARRRGRGELAGARRAAWWR